MALGNLIKFDVPNIRGGAASTADAVDALLAARKRREELDQQAWKRDFDDRHQKYLEDLASQNVKLAEATRDERLRNTRASRIGDIGKLHSLGDFGVAEALAAADPTLGIEYYGPRTGRGPDTMLKGGARPTLLPELQTPESRLSLLLDRNLPGDEGGKLPSLSPPQAMPAPRSAPPQEEAPPTPLESPQALALRAKVRGSMGPGFDAPAAPQEAPDLSGFMKAMEPFRTLGLPRVTGPAPREEMGAQAPTEPPAMGATGPAGEEPPAPDLAPARGLSLMLRGEGRPTTLPTIVPGEERQLPGVLKVLGKDVELPAMAREEFELAKAQRKRDQLQEMISNPNFQSLDPATKQQIQAEYLLAGMTLKGQERQGITNALAGAAQRGGTADLQRERLDAAAKEKDLDRELARWKVKNRPVGENKKLESGLNPREQEMAERARYVDADNYVNGYINQNNVKAINQQLQDAVASMEALKSQYSGAKLLGMGKFIKIAQGNVGVVNESDYKRFGTDLIPKGDVAKRQWDIYMNGGAVDSKYVKPFLEVTEQVMLRKFKKLADTHAREAARVWGERKLPGSENLQGYIYDRVRATLGAYEIETGESDPGEVKDLKRGAAVIPNRKELEKKSKEAPTPDSLEARKESWRRRLGGR